MVVDKLGLFMFGIPFGESIYHQREKSAKAALGKTLGKVSTQQQQWMRGRKHNRFKDKIQYSLKEDLEEIFLS